MSEAAISDARRKPGMLGVFAWAAFVVVGWIVFAYIAFVAPGGLTAAWNGVRGLPLLAQLLMWGLLLPWMIALWVWQTGWAAWLRVLLVLGLWWASMILSIPQVMETMRSR